MKEWLPLFQKGKHVIRKYKISQETVEIFNSLGLFCLHDSSKNTYGKISIFKKCISCWMTIILAIQFCELWIGLRFQGVLRLTAWSAISPFFNYYEFKIDWFAANQPSVVWIYLNCDRNHVFKLWHKKFNHCQCFNHTLPHRTLYAICQDGFPRGQADNIIL